jgi:hypothetical protein
MPPQLEPVLTTLSISEYDRVGHNVGKLSPRHEATNLSIPNKGVWFEVIYDFNADFGFEIGQLRRSASLAIANILRRKWPMAIKNQQIDVQYHTGILAR